MIEQRIDLLTKPNLETNGQQELLEQPKVSIQLQRLTDKPQTSAGFKPYSILDYKLPKTASTSDINAGRRRSSSTNRKACPKQFMTPSEYTSEKSSIHNKVRIG